MNPNFLIPILAFLVSCATVPEKQAHPKFAFPEMGAFVDLPNRGDSGREYQVMGWVRAKAHWSTLDQDSYNDTLCRNYYNKASRNLLREAIKVGADAVIQIRSVVFMLDGQVREFPTPECSDDGAEGEVLLRGIAIKYKSLATESKKGLQR